MNTPPSEHIPNQTPTGLRAQRRKRARRKTIARKPRNSVTRALVLPRMTEGEFEQWFKSEREYGIRWAISRGVPDAENIVHNALLATLQAFQPARCRSLSSFYRVILNRRITDEIRRLYGPWIIEPLENDDFPHDVEADPLRDDWRDLLKSILRLLDAKTTKFLRDHHVRGKSLLELSEIHGTSIDAIKQRCFRYREQARAILRAHGLRCMGDVENFRGKGRLPLPAPALPRGTCRNNRHPHAK